MSVHYLNKKKTVIDTMSGVIKLIKMEALNNEYITFRGKMGVN